MNLVGKIFVVIIFVLSLVFMTTAMVVYTMQKNWRDVVLNPQTGLAPKLQIAQHDKQVLTDQLEKLKKDVEAEKKAQQQAYAKVENERDTLRQERKTLEASLAELEKAKRDAVAAMNATQKNATDFRQQLDKLRTDTLQSQQDRDAHFKKVVELTDQLNEAANEKEQLRKRMEDLSKDLAKARDALRYFDINENSDYKAKVPPRVFGHVTAALEHGLVEISLGSDDGIRKGHQLEIYRVGGGQNTYVGRVEVVQTSPDKSVCKVDPKFQNSNVMVGDRVASKID
jgi:uncharacterized protein YhaN